MMNVTKSRKYQIRFNNSVAGVVFVSYRHNGRGEWQYGRPPQSLVDYLFITNPDSSRRFLNREMITDMNHLVELAKEDKNVRIMGNSGPGEYSLTLMVTVEEQVEAAARPIKPATPAQLKKIAKLEAELNKLTSAPRPVITPDEVFEFAPEGDFRVEGDEAGDWHVYNCGESDCPRGWHKVAYAVTYYREGGKRGIEVGTCDEDGNWDYETAWEEGDNFADVAMYFDTRDYFTGWAEYYLDCARTGTDVLGEFFRDPSVSNFIRSAATNIKYLRPTGGAK